MSLKSAPILASLLAGASMSAHAFILNVDNQTGQKLESHGQPTYMLKTGNHADYYTPGGNGTPANIGMNDNYNSDHFDTRPAAADTFELTNLGFSSEQGVPVKDMISGGCGLLKVKPVTQDEVVTIILNPGPLSAFGWHTLDCKIQTR